MYDRGRSCLLITGGIYIASTTGACAHVKWFSPYNISEPPRELVSAFNLDLALLLALSILFLFIGCAIGSLAVRHQRL